MGRFLVLVVAMAFLLAGCASIDAPLTGQATHGTYGAFSAPEPGFTIGNGRMVVSDDAVYKTGWYSVNGSAWQQFSLSGSAYGASSSWLAGAAYAHLPAALSAPGEHYMIVYSCSNSSGRWDCHGGWQLQVIADPYALVYLDKGSDCGDVLDYQCGSRAICGSVADFGDCPSGYDCADNLCLARDDLTCDGVVCGAGEYCSRGVCLLSVPGATYFVAPWGNDSNSGTFEEPFYSWQQAADILQPGDIAYYRGGVWYPTTYIRASSTIALLIDPTGYAPGTEGGTAEAPIRYFNYPGEKPILDGSLMEPSETRWLSGISIGSVEHIHLKGLTVRQIHQTPPDFSYGKPYSEAFGLGSGGANHRFENVVVHDIDGRGFQHWSQAWSATDAQYAVELCLERQESLPDGGDPASCTYFAPLFSSDNTSWINCDTYNLFDRYSLEPGNAADGWKVGTYSGSTFTWTGCRAWNYSDDGFDPHGTGTRIFENCWAMSTLKYEGLSGIWGIEGNGFKTTSIAGVPLGESRVLFKGCIATYNIGYAHGTGFIANIGGAGDEGQYSSMPTAYNNLAYYNSWGYSGRDLGDYRNNIVFDSQAIGPTGTINELEFSSNVLPATEIDNTWISIDPRPGSWPWWDYNPAYTVTAEDFVSLDYSQLARPRKADGSLPDVTFGHLAPGSDLIDRGTVIPGYHCATAGAHPGEECVVWFGAAPDLGPFEYQG
jgi:hypothetical protein